MNKIEISKTDVLYDFAVIRMHGDRREHRDLNLFKTIGERHHIPKTLQVKIDAVVSNKSQTHTTTKIFLYLKPQSIIYPEDDATSALMRVDHPLTVINKMSDHYTTNNTFRLTDFEIEKPIFTMRLEQDGIDDAMAFGSTPLALTLYEYTVPKTGEYDGGEIQAHATAQGYLDIMSFFSKKRNLFTIITFLYPLDPYSSQKTCKMTWEIYSLMPLIKDIQFSNVLIISFASLFNVDESLLKICDDLVATLSWHSTFPTTNEYTKVFICKFTVFVKKIIAEQNPNYKWENLKDPSLNNFKSMGLNSNIKVDLFQLFNDLLCTENVNFNFEDINVRNDYALVCNSIHRFVLTDSIHKALEQHLVYDRPDITIEIFSESNPEKILLQGSIDPSIFVYPKVTNCSFAVQMKPPALVFTEKQALKTHKSKEMGQRTTFAIVNMCLKVPITEPADDLAELLNVSSTDPDIFAGCLKTWMPEKRPPKLGEKICEENYHKFDNNILQLIHDLSQDPAAVLKYDKKCFCTKIQNLGDQILQIIGCDFNVRYPTETREEFTNLMTTVYRELVKRSYDLVQKYEHLFSELGLTYADDQSTLIYQISIAKFMYEIRNDNMNECILRQLKEKFGYNAIYKFYMFLYDIEMQNYDLAREYIERPLRDENAERQRIIDICKIYLDYVRDKNDADFNGNLEENLLHDLRSHCEHVQNRFVIGWMLLYCVYKRHNYQPGMSYTRWKYENCSKVFFIDIKNLPQSRWEIFNDFEPTLKTDRAKYFWKAIKILLRLGLYIFAQWLYDDIARECSEVERYILEASFKLFTNQLENFTIVKNFQIDYLPNATTLTAFVHLINGNIEHFRNSEDASWMKYYASIINTKDIGDPFAFQLGILRYAYELMRQEDYELAIKVFDFASDSNGHNLIIDGGKAKALYFLNRLEECKILLAHYTTYGIYNPNVWAYLALINLRLGENYNALECWKYARLDPEIPIQENLLEDLDKVDPNNIFLNVDVPNIIIRN